MALERMAIHLKGVREHNLKNIEVRLPRNELVVITGPSGSGKSSLAFDTLYAEGQRRYLESLSAYARHFLEQVPKPDVDRVEGLSPALAIQQRGLGRNPRSTVGTITEIIPFLRLLYARLGEPHCPKCKIKVSAGHPSLILKELLHLPEGSAYLVLAPVLRGRRGEQRSLLASLRKKGYARIRVDGEIHALDELEALKKGARHDVDLVVDRLKSGSGSQQRLTASVEKALAEGDGSLIISPLSGGKEKVYSDRLACPKCGTGFAILEPRLFSFNSPAGACRSCRGLGSTRSIAENLLIPDPSLSLRDGGLAPLSGKNQSFIHEQVDYLVRRLGFDDESPLSEMDQQLRRALLFGTMGKEFEFLREGISGHERFLADFEGLIPMLTRRARETKSQRIRSWCEEFMEERQCPDCHGTRLRPEALSVEVFGRDLGSVSELPLVDLLEVLKQWHFEGSEALIGEPLQKEIESRLGFLVQAGLGYLTLSRPVSSLSGGEGQRVRLATQVGGRLTGVLYVLDEPSVGLHARDNARLIELLGRLVDRGNSLVVVEHDRDIIEAASHVVDLGPGAGDHGGEVVAQGTPQEIQNCEDSPTGRWLAQPLTIPARDVAGDSSSALVIRQARARNLRGIDVTLPLGKFIAVTGVSGSGKSTLVHEILYRALARELHGALAKPGDHAGIEGSGALDKVILIDQQPIGRSPRSTPATFTGLYTYLRKILAQTPAAKARGFDQGRFSFNTKGGRCEACDGAGVRTLTMDFLPQVRVVCDVCGGRRFNRQTLEVSYKGRSIADYLQMTIEEATELLDPVPSMRRILGTLQEVGLGYLRLGQAADTLSGGEAQRLKLAKELSRPSTGRTLYLLDEPTTGLHFQDVEMLLAVLSKLVDKGNTVLVIEHHPEVILAADWIVDLGPEGGQQGGSIVVEGALDTVMKCADSHTGRMLRRQLNAA